MKLALFAPEVHYCPSMPKGFLVINGILSYRMPLLFQTISATGSMIFDIDDIDEAASGAGFEDLVLHEMGHVIGIG